MSQEALPDQIGPYSVFVIACLVQCTGSYLNKQALKENIQIVRQLERLKQQRDDIFSAIPDGIIVFTLDNKVQVANFFIKNALSAQNNTQIANALTKIQIKHRFLLDLVRENLQYGLSDTVQLGVQKEGHNRFEWYAKRTIWNYQEAVLLTCRDISHIYQFNRAKSESQFKTVMLRSFSHELKTPLNAIAYYSGLANQSANLSSDDKEWMRIIQNSSNYMSYVVDDIIDYSSMLSGQIRIERQAFKIIPFLEKTLKVLEYKATMGKVALKLETAKDLPVIANTDPSRLSQIIINLLSNAIKFTYKGEITLKVKPKDLETLEFKVVDTGIGIEPEKLACIQRELNIQTEGRLIKIHSNGIGLGLNISKMLLTQLKGKMTVESILSEGSTFTFSLHSSPGEAYFADDLINIEESDSIDSVESPYIFPMSKSQTIPKETLTCDEIVQTDPLKDVQVLIADDNYETRNQISQALIQSRITFHEAFSGSDAVKSILDFLQIGGSYRVLVINCEMSMMNGWQTAIKLQELTSLGLLNFIPTIIGYSEVESIEGAIDSLNVGMVKLLRKPVDQDELIRVLKRFI